MTLIEILREAQNEASWLLDENARLFKEVHDLTEEVAELRGKNVGLEKKVVEVIEKNSGLEFLVNELQKRANVPPKPRGFRSLFSSLSR